MTKSTKAGEHVSSSRPSPGPPSRSNPDQQQQQPPPPLQPPTASSTFSPNLHVEDLHVNYWLRQVTLRLRREIYWRWYESGMLQHTTFPPSNPTSPFDTTVLPPFADKAVEALSQSRDWEKKNRFFKTDSTMKYLSQQLQTTPPPTSEEIFARGSFGWVIDKLRLDNVSSFVLAMALIVPFDSAAGSVISACLGDSMKSHPTLALAQRLWDYPEQVLTLFDPSHPLRRYGLLRFSKQYGNNSPYTETNWDDKIEMAPLLVNQLLFPNLPMPEYLRAVVNTPTTPVGDNCSSNNNRGGEEREDVLEESKIDADLTAVFDLLASQLTSNRSDGNAGLKVVPVCGEKYCAHADMVSRIGKITNRDIVEFVGDPLLLEDKSYMNSIAAFCWLKDVDLFLGRDVLSVLVNNSNNTTSKQQEQKAQQQLPYQDINSLLPFQSIPITIFLALSDRSELGYVPSRLLLPPIQVPKLSYDQRIAYWKRMLGTKASGLDEVISECSRTFRYEKESINAISKGLCSLSRPITREDFVLACRTELEADFGGLAQRVEPRFSEEELILPHKQSLQFKDIVNAMKSLTKVHYKMGMAQAMNESGIFVLFSGPSGSGKTMAAEILANILDLPMYRIDLSQVANKYIGETEKNLKRLFDAAEMCDVILFFDEADSTFGHRSEAKDAHDMYANQQISYLLERIERFKGLAVLATNRKNDLDEAFSRRLRYTIDFPFPGEQERKMMWRIMIPESVDYSQIDINFLAKRFQLTGGHIRSIVFNACLQCANNFEFDKVAPRCQLTMEQVIIAIRREYDKFGRSISLEQFQPYDKILKSIGYE